MPMQPGDIRRFLYADSPTGSGPRGQIVHAVEQSSFTLEYVHEPAPYSQPAALRKGENFGLFLKPRSAAKRLYGLDREILLWCSTYSRVQARDTSALYAVVEKFGARLSRQFAILATKYERGDKSELEAEAKFGQSLVHVSIDEIVANGIDTLLAKYLYSRNLFDVTGAAVSPADFFGRRELIDRLVGEIETGTSQMGVFGLRKVGKTSLLNRLSDKLQHSSRVVVARLDLQWTTSINGKPEYTLWALGESLFTSHRSIRAVKGLRLFGQFRTFSDIQSMDDIWEWFAHDVMLIMNSSKRGVCILIDEIERMYEQANQRGFVRFWRLLRGLDQQNPGRLRIVIGGTSPQCAELGVVDGQDNPLFNYLQLDYLGPLSRPDSSRLIHTLGSSMGLIFGEAAIEWAWQQCGGHPALLRAFGSTVHQALVGREEPVEIGLDHVERVEHDLSQRASSTIDQMISALEDQYQDEYELLQFLAQGQLFQFEEFGRAWPNEVQRLKRYGLVTDGAPPSVGMRQLHTNLLRREEVRQLPPRTQPLLPRGALIGKWEVHACLASGGYAEVYKVEQAQIAAAAKVLKTGHLSSLEREVDVLSELEHPGIVKFSDSIRTDEGRPCLIMELLEGQDASNYCTPSTAPTTRDWFSWLTDILAALEAMHPRLREAKKYEMMESLDSASYSRWSQAKHGYVHRDIKPENIMIVPDRGPVLIDFNISVRSGAPVLTTSATAGYLPPLDVDWTPAYDLYALGVTFLELGAGLRLATCSVEELQMITAAQHGKRATELTGLLLSAGDSDHDASTIRALASIYSSAILDTPTA